MCRGIQCTSLCVCLCGCVCVRRLKVDIGTLPRPSTLFIETRSFSWVQKFLIWASIASHLPLGTYYFFLLNPGTTDWLLLPVTVYRGFGDQNSDLYTWVAFYPLSNLASLSISSRLHSISLQLTLGFPQRDVIVSLIPGRTVKSWFSTTHCYGKASFVEASFENK